MVTCCVYLNYDDECDMLFDLDEDEQSELHCDSDGICLYEYKLCPYYQDIYDDDDNDSDEDY